MSFCDPGTLEQTLQCELWYTALLVKVDPGLIAVSVFLTYLNHALKYLSEKQVNLVGLLIKSSLLTL